MIRMPLAIACLALVLVGAAIVAVVADSAARFHPRYWIDRHSDQVSAAEMSAIDRTFDLARVKNVRIVTNSMDVHVVPATGGGASDQMRVTGRAPAQKVVVEFEREGDSAVLTLRETGDWPFGAMGSNQSQPFTIALDEHRPLDIESASGDLTVSDPQAPVSIQSASGDIAVTSAHGPVRIETASGDVTLHDATDDVNLRTLSGDIVAAGLARTIDVHTTSGSATLGFAPNWSGTHATIGTMSGDVVLDVPRDFRASLQTSTSSGDVSNEAKLPAALSDAPAISASTMSGDISVR